MFTARRLLRSVLLRGLSLPADACSAALKPLRLAVTGTIMPGEVVGDAEMQTMDASNNSPHSGGKAHSGGYSAVGVGGRPSALKVVLNLLGATSAVIVLILTIGFVLGELQINEGRLTVAAHRAVEDRRDAVVSEADQPFAIAIHGGAGTIARDVMTAEQEADYRQMLNASTAAGFEVSSSQHATAHHSLSAAAHWRCTCVAVGQLQLVLTRGPPPSRS